MYFNCGVLQMNITKSDNEKATMINKTKCRMIQVILIALTACTSTKDISLQPSANLVPSATINHSKTIFFPHQEKTDGERIVMDGEVEGSLILVGDCIRLSSDEADTSYLLIWPPDFNMIDESGSLKILNGDGEIVAQIGDRVQIGGGEIYLASMLDESIQRQVPPQCTGPYWIIGNW